MRSRTGLTELSNEDFKKETDRKEESKNGGKGIVQDAFEEDDIIIKYGFAEMVKQFFKDYAIVWHDPNVDSEENKQYIAQLEKFCEVYTFKEWKEASSYVATAKAACYIITSGTDGEQFVKEIDSKESVVKIYVFCGNKDYHSTWTANYQKISCVETQIINIFGKIQQNLLEWYKEASSLKSNLPAFAPIFNDTDKSSMNNLHRYLKVIPNFKNRLRAKNDLLALSRRIYLDETNISFMKDFKRNYDEYNPESILNWYTKESFLFKVTNNCLRIANSDSIQYCRLVLKDLERAIKEQYQEKSKHFHGLLYRAASLSEGEWSHLKANLGREIEMHGFLSVSKDKNKAMNYIYIDETKNTFITVLVPKGPNDEEQGFAEVEQYSNYPHEKEILFNVRSRFTVLETEDTSSDDLSIRHLVLLYGAHGFRRFVAEKNPIQEFSVQNSENISCSLCKESTTNNMYFAPISSEKIQICFCRKCLPDFLQDHDGPILCLLQEKGMKQISFRGFLTTYPMGLGIPMYGYQCCQCQKGKEKMYYKCAECYNENKNIWCDDCTEGFSGCLQKRHHIILEQSPFSFWCDKMSQKELDHLKFHNEIVEETDPFQQGEMYVESHEYQKAIDYYQIYIGRVRDDQNDFLVAVAQNNLAHIYAKQADYKKAYDYHSRALETRELFYGDNHPNVATSYSQMGSIYKSQAQYDKALDYHSRALEIDKLFYGDNHPNVATSYSQMGNVYERQAQYDKALDYYSRALEINKSFYGDNHPEVATSYSQMGIVYESQTQYDKALDYYSRALEIDKLFYGDNYPNVATSYSKMGNVYASQAQYDKALDYHSRALETRKLFYGDNHPEVATSYSQMGNVYASQAQYDKALDYYSRALEIDKLFYGDNHPNVATSYSQMGSIYESQTQYDKALDYYSRALEIDKLFYGDNHPEVATSYSQMGSIYESQAQYDKALDYHSKALETRKLFYGDNHPNVATSYSKMGNVYASQAQYDKALDYYSRALEIDKLFYGDNHPEVATSLHNMAMIYCVQAEYQKALEYHFKALEIDKSSYGDKSLPLANLLTGLGTTYFFLGESNKSLEYYFQALEIKKISFK